MGISRRRNILAWSTIAVLAMLIAGSLLILVHPTLLTGRFYEFTVKSMKRDSYDYVIVTYDDFISCDTEVTWTFRLSGTSVQTQYDSWEQKPDRFLSWPRKSQDQTFGVLMMPGTRLLLNEGTYRIRPGEGMKFIETTLPNGETRPSEIAVKSKP